MITQAQFTLSAVPRGFHLITNQVLSNLPDLPETGLLHLFLKHTSAALTINENADPDVRTDMAYIFDKLVKDNDSGYRHILEGNDDMPAHAKTSLCGNTLSIPITRYHLNMGTWQGIYLCEFRHHGGARKMVATIIG